MSLWQRLRRSRLFRYGMAAFGPVGGAVTQFLLSVQMLHALPPAGFGSFAFLLVLFQFSTGVSLALFCAPLPMIIQADRKGGSPNAQRGIFTMNLVFCLAAAALFLAIALMFGLSASAAALFAAYAGIALLRWLARAHGYAIGTPARTVASDSLYAAILAVSMVLLWFRGEPSVADAAGALLVSAACGLLPFGADYLRSQFVNVRLSDVARYRPVWVDHARWALLGVLTTEATSNAHAYIVTATAGPRAFAPLAAAALMIRPIAVVMNALSEFERPRIAREIARGQGADRLRGSVNFMRLVLMAGWLSSAALAAGLLFFAPHLVFPPDYTRADLMLGVALWLTIAAARCWRAPASTLLQAAGEFRNLAFASVASCLISIVGVLGALWLAGVLWSLLGVLLGEIAFAVWVARKAADWYAARAPANRSHGPST